MSVQAVLLAAGCARRMQPLSDACHKALLPIAGRSILARLVDGLQEAGAHRITVVTGYRADEVRAHLTEDCPGPDYRFVHNAGYAETNNIVSLALALESLPPGGADVLLAECDLVLAPGVLAPLADAAGGGNVALVDRYRTGMDGTVVRLAGGVVSQLVTPEQQDAGFDYRETFKTLNLYRFARGFCDDVLLPQLRAHLAQGRSGAYYEAVLASLGDLAPQGIRAAVVPAGAWAEVDDPHDLAAARFAFEPTARREVIDRGRGGQWALDLLDFAYLRNAHFPPEPMLAALRHALPRLIEGYGSAQPVLDEKLAWFLRTSPHATVALSGASQAYPILRRLWAGERVAIPSPTFGEYPRAFPAATTYADDPDDGIDAGELERAAQAGGVVVVVNPNNPTGTLIPSAELHALAARHPATTFLVDESFQGFSAEPPLVALLERAPLRNVVVLCSLSKVLGAPGIRLGYLHATDEAVLRAVREELPIWSVGALAEHFAELLLKFRPELEASLVRTRDDRAQLAEDLAAIPGVAAVREGGADFLLVTLDGDDDEADRLRDRLLEDAAIDVKVVTDRFPDGRPRLRIAVRLPEEHRRLVAALRAGLPAVAAR